LRKRCILITGGARSGKSRFAQELARGLKEPVLFVATAEGGDQEMRQRIAKHRAERPANWDTLEATQSIGDRIIKQEWGAGVIIVDCITLLVSNIMGQHCDQNGNLTDVPLIEEKITSEITSLIEYIKRTDSVFIIVTNEVGLGLVPLSEMSRLYRDLLGKANQQLAELADEVYFMIAGLPMQIKPVPR
jgi:adenosylcobinamide kinase/adenosylcobinamide-phosphate guanylyltransferase